MRVIWNILAVLFTLLSFGAISETARVVTSNEESITSQGETLMMTSVGITAAVIISAAFLWYKALSRKR